MDKTDTNLPKKLCRKSRDIYPTKRNNYRKYVVASWTWQQVFEEIEVLKSNEKGVCKKISNKYNIPYNTLKDKYRKWLSEDKVDATTSIENRGGHNKIFSEEEERSLFEYIKEVYINCCLFFDDECLKLLAIKKWNEIHTDQKDLFKASSGWIYDFKRKWGLSSLKSKESKKSTINNDNDLDNYLKICKEIGTLYIKTNVFNMDETFWRIINGNPQVIGITGSENRKVITNTNTKSGFTAIFLISADGTFMKPIIIIKGKTNRCLNKTGQKSDALVFRKFTKSGWIDVTIMKFILSEINRTVNGTDSVLILDEYSVHTDLDVKNEAVKMNIKLIYVPAGKTATNQPLDVLINGAIKSIGKKITKEIFIDDPFATPTIADSIETLIEAKNKITRETIIKSFSLACNL
jgi:hypothetical protein